MLLYILVVDSEIGKLGYEIRQRPDTLICLAQRALEFSDTDAEAKWQLMHARRNQSFNWPLPSPLPRT